VVVQNLWSRGNGVVSDRLLSLDNATSPENLAFPQGALLNAPAAHHPRPDAGLPVVPLTAPGSDAPEHQCPLVLVVDDDDDSRVLMAYILEHLACRTCFVADGLTALAAAQHYRPNLIVSDIHLPQVDGYGLIQRLRADAATCQIPVLAVTALAGAADRQRILAAGFDDYISKPFLIQPLEQLIHHFIDLSLPEG
jgi:CheY-like chemotaxis protein